MLHHAIRVALDAVARKRRGSGRTSLKPAEVEATPEAEQQHSRYIPADVRDEVWRRDDGRCAFVGAEGRRCNSTHRLELDHLIPFARGGPSTVANLRVTCASHNGYLAEQHFGADHIAMAIAGRNGALG